MKRIIILILLISISCTSKPDVIIINGNTYYFEEGVENFYIVDMEGNKVKITK